LEIATRPVTAWVATRLGNMLILTEQSTVKKVFDMDPKSREFSIINRGKKTVLGELLRVDLSPEALLDSIDIREGDKILLLPAGSGVAG